MKGAKKAKGPADVETERSQPIDYAVLVRNERDVLEVLPVRWWPQR